MYNIHQPSIAAAAAVAQQVTGLTLQVGAPTAKQKIDNRGLAVTIQFSGGINGCVAFVMSRAAACNIASYIMGGFTVTRLDEVTKSAIGELCNMMMGTTAELFSRQNIILDITPPEFYVGELRLNTLCRQITYIPLGFSDKAQMDMYISLYEQ